MSEFLNLSNIPASYPSNYSPPEKYIDLYRPAIVGVIDFFGILGNLLTVLVLTNDPQKSTPKFFMVVLAVLDILLLILYSCHYTAKLPDYLERLNRIIMVTVKMLEIYVVVMISLDRFLALKFPLKSTSICTVTNARKALFVCTIFCIIFKIPEAVELYNDLNSSLFLYIYTYGLNQFFNYIGPLILISCLNGCLVHQLHKRGPEITSDSFEVDARKFKLNQREQRHRNVSITLVCVVSCFLIFETPIYLYMNIHQIYNVKTMATFLLYNSMIYLSLLNFSCNFIIYGLVGNRFRTMLKRTITRIFCPKSNKKQPITGSSVFGFNSEHVRNSFYNHMLTNTDNS